MVNAPTCTYSVAPFNSSLDILLFLAFRVRVNVQINVLSHTGLSITFKAAGGQILKMASVAVVFLVIFKL